MRRPAPCRSASRSTACPRAGRPRGGDERVGLLLARLRVLDLDAAAEPDHVGLRLDLAHLRREQLLADAQDLGLQVRLVVLGVVVLGVLLEIAPLARGLDALGDLPPRDGLQVLELGLQRLQALGGHDNGSDKLAILVLGRKAATPLAVIAHGHQRVGDPRAQHEIARVARERDRPRRPRHRDRRAPALGQDGLQALPDGGGLRGEDRDVVDGGLHGHSLHEHMFAAT